MKSGLGRVWFCMLGLCAGEVLAVPTLFLGPLGFPNGQPGFRLVSTAGVLVLSSLGAGDGSPGWVVDLCTLPDLDAVGPWAANDPNGNS